MSKTFNRYLVKHVALNFAAVVIILMVILVASRFATFMSAAAEGSIDPASVFTLLGLTSLHFMVLMVPPALLLAIQLALGKLYRDSEMHAVMACGIGVMQLYRPLLWFAGLLSVFVAVLALYLTPWAGEVAAQVRGKAAHEAKVGLLEAGRFQSFDRGKAVLFAEQVDSVSGELSELFLHSENVSGDQTDTVVRAESGHFAVDKTSGDRSLVLRNGYRYEGQLGSQQWEVTQFEEHGVYFSLPAPDVKISERSLKPTTALLASEKLADKAELQWRIAYPFAVFILTLLAVPLAKVEPRQGRYGTVIAGMLAYVIYFNLMGVAKLQIERGNLPPSLGIWLVHGLALVVTAVLLWRQGVFVRVPKALDSLKAARATHKVPAA